MIAPSWLHGDQIRSLVAEVADELDVDGPPHVLVIVGGSLLAWHNLREATRDVDSIRRLDDELRSAVASVAARHDLSSDWLNDRAAPFAPRGISLERCDPLLDHPRLTIYGAPLRDVFLMKIARGGPQDQSDMQAIWPHIASEFRTVGEIVDAFFYAFPDAYQDEYLDQFVVEILEAAGHVPPPAS